MGFMDSLFGGGDQEAPDYSAIINQMKFTPWAVFSGYGRSNIDAANNTASYTLSPELANIRDSFYRGARQAVPGQAQIDFNQGVSGYGQNMFNKYANLDTNQVTQDYYNQQQNLLRPSRLQSNVDLADKLFTTGRSGAAIGYQGANNQQGYVNPEQFAQMMAQNQQDSQLLLDAEDRARGIQEAGMKQGLGYYGMGDTLTKGQYGNANTLFGYGTGIEGLGMQNMDTGMNYGQLASQANTPMYKMMMQQENDRVAAENANSGGGLFGSLLGGAVSEFAPGLGKWAKNSLFGSLGGASNGGTSYSGGIRF